METERKQMMIMILEMIEFCGFTRIFSLGVFDFVFFFLCP